MNIFNWNKSKNDNPKDLRKKINVHSFSTRIKQDVSNWRDAIKEAENQPYMFRVKMQQMFRDTVLNGHVKACINKRKNISLLSEYGYYIDNEKNIDLTNKLFNKNWFKNILNYIIDAKLYGYSYINWLDYDELSVKDIQIINREFVNVDMNILSSTQYSTSGLQLDNKDINDWTLLCTTNSEHGISKCGFGLLYEVAMYEIILRNLLGYNADYAENFGQPVLIADTDKTSDDERFYLEEQLQALGSGGYMVKDIGDSVEYLEYNQVANGYSVYDNLEKRCEAKISKILLGHADAIDSTPGKLGSGSELSPQQIALREVRAIDIDYIENIVNDILLPKLKALGLDIPDGVFKYDNNEEQELSNKNRLEYNKSVVELTKNLHDANISVDTDWLSEELNIPLKQKHITDE